MIEPVFRECPVCGNAFAYTDVCPACNAELKEVEVNQNETDNISW